MADGGQMWAQLNQGADPIGAFAKGASLAAQLQSITQASQAQSFRNTLDVLRLNNEQQDMRQREALAREQMDISRFNAETNRINAMRPSKTSTGGYGGGANNLIQLPDGNFGVDLGPADGPADVPHGTEEVADQPTIEGGVTSLQGAPEEPMQAGFYPGVGAAEGTEPSGEGDMTTPPDAQRVPQTAGLTMPIQGSNNGSNPLLPAMGGQAAPAASPTSGQIQIINGRKVRPLPPNTTITNGPRGTTVTTRTPAATKPKEVAPLDWDTMGKLAAFGGLELTGVEGFDANGRPQPKFEKPKEKKATALYDFDQLKEETQKQIMDSFKKVAFPVPPGGFTDQEKMAAVGIVLPPDADQAAIEAAGAKMTPELWTRGYNILKEQALAGREQAIMEHAALLTSVAGKPVSPEDVVKMLPKYTPPADSSPSKPNVEMGRMTETGESANAGAPPAASAAAAEAPKLTADQRRELGDRAKELRQKIADGGIDPQTGLQRPNPEATAELERIQEQLKGSTAAPTAAPAAAAGTTPAASAQAPTGPIRSYAEMQTLRKEEEQKPLKEEDAKQWQSAKQEALNKIEKAAKKSGVPPQSILASIARGGADKHSALSLAGVWDEFKGKDRYAFKRKASTPGLNQVTWEEVIESLADSADLLQERYGITPEQLRAGGGQARRDLYK